MRPRRRPTRRARRLAALVTVVAVALVPALTTGGAPPAGAQAELVKVSTRTVPEVPEPGDDVTVLVRATGCPPGGTIVEVYLTSNDGATTAAALMAREEPPATLFFRVRAEIELPDAIEGWYGVRIVCGQFRPARTAMPNTTFRVGVKPTKEMRVLGTEVVEGQSLRIEGTGCPGTTVEYDITQSGLKTSPFVPDGTLPVLLDGSWGGDVVFPLELGAGRAEVRARCGLRNQFGDQVWVNYGGLVEVEVRRAPEPPAGT